MVRVYVILAVIPWKHLQLDNEEQQVALNMAEVSGEIGFGFLRVFLSKEVAEKYANGSEVKELMMHRDSVPIVIG